MVSYLFDKNELIKIIEITESEMVGGYGVNHPMDVVTMLLKQWFQATEEVTLM